MVEVNKKKLMEMDKHTRDMKNKLNEVKRLANDIAYYLDSIEVTSQNFSSKEDIKGCLLAIKKQLDK